MNLTWSSVVELRLVDDDDVPPKQVRLELSLRVNKNVTIHD